MKHSKNYKNMMEEGGEMTYYFYVVNGKEYFTSNIDLAYKRADIGTDIRIKTIKKNY